MFEIQKVHSSKRSVAHEKILNMEEPYTLLSLPHPLDSTNGRTQSAPVFTLRGSRKRKRHEITVGIDGESINVYNIQTQALQSAYAIPPQTYLCCPPSSYYSPTFDSKDAQRDTFVVLRDGVKDTGRRLIRFTEKTSPIADFTVPVKVEYRLSDGDTLAVDALPSSSLSQHQSPQALVSYTNGEVTCVSEDMSKALWKQSVLLEEDKDGLVEHVSLVDVATAQKGLLQSREDILAMLKSSQSTVTTLVTYIIRTTSSTILRYFAIGAGSDRAGLQQLDDVILPDSGSGSSQASTWHVSAVAGQLFRLHEGILYLYDLSGITPRLSLTIKERGTSITAFVSISASLVLVTTLRQAVIYDTTYGSVQATTSFGAHLGRPTGTKRKRDESITAVSQRVSLHWFPASGIAVASLQDLVGVQLNSQLSSTNTKQRAVRLSAVIGKSAANAKTFTSTPDDDTDRYDRRRDKWRCKLETVIAEHNTQSLEAFISQEFKINNASDKENGLTELWAFSDEPFEHGPTQKLRALDLVQHMFILNSSEDPTSTLLRMQLYSRNIIRWLFVADILTASNLSKIFNHDMTTKDIAQTLTAADPSFQLMLDILELSVHLPITYLVECLRLLIRSLDSVPSNSVNASTDEMDITRSQEDVELDNEAIVAEAELSNALVTLQSGLQIRSVTMALLFGRLHACPRSTLTKHLRQGLQLKDLIFFVHLLRIELAEAGWTRPYVEIGSNDAMHDEDTLLDEEATPSDRAIRPIGNLLVAAVDAVGAAGWLVGLTPDEDEQYGLLDALHAEISASLEGVYEAQTLRSYLDEFERYTLSLYDKPTNTVSQSGVIQVQNPAVMEDGVIMPWAVGAALSLQKRLFVRKGSLQHLLISSRRNIWKAWLVCTNSSA